MQLLLLDLLIAIVVQEGLLHLTVGAAQGWRLRRLVHGQEATGRLLRVPAQHRRLISCIGSLVVTAWVQGNAMMIVLRQLLRLQRQMKLLYGGALMASLRSRHSSRLRALRARHLSSLLRRDVLNVALLVGGDARTLLLLWQSRHTAALAIIVTIGGSVVDAAVDAGLRWVADAVYFALVHWVPSRRLLLSALGPTC